MKCRFLFAATLLSLFCRPADMMGDSLDDLTVKDGVVQIGTAEDFLNFSIAVNEGNSTLNAVLTQDIDLGTDLEGSERGIMSTLTMVGGIPANVTDLSKSAAWYAGTFDGQYHTITFEKTKAEFQCWGLFGLLTGIIKNLHVAGTIATGFNFNAGIVSTINGGTVENCLCTVNITDGQTHGGISRVTMADKGCTIRGCVFAGTLAGGNGAGFTYGVGGNAVIENCLLMSFGASSGNKFFRNKGVCTNCFYLDTIETGGDNSGTTAVTSETLASGLVCYQLNGGNTDNPAWRQTIGSGEIRLGVGDIVYLVGKYKCDHTTPAEGSDPVYTNTQGATEYEAHTFVDGLCSVCETVIDEDYLEDGRFPIATSAQFLNFAKIVNNINPAMDAFLTADINLDDVLENLPMIGFSGFENGIMVSSNGAYAGTFDGQFHTITYHKEATGNIWGLFGCLSGTIKNLHVTGSITTDYLYMAALANTLHGGIINDCLCDVDIVTTGESGFHGGFSRVTTNSGGTVERCIYSGDITGQTALSCASIVCYAEKGTQITNTLFTGTFDINLSNGKSYIIARGSATCKNCYYLNETTANVNAGASQMTEEQLVDGSACFMINEGNTVNPAWRQTIGSDEMPVLSPDAPIVYGVDEVYANVTDNASLQRFISAIIDKENEFCGGVVAQASVVSDFLTMTEKLHECENVESLLKYATDNLLPQKDRILSSKEAYAAYQKKVSETITYIDERPEISNVVRDELYSYLVDDEDPGDTFTNGSAIYILDVLELDENQLAEEIEYIEMMIAKMLSYDPSPGMEITQLFTNTNFEKGFDGWNGTVGTATGTVETSSLHAAECYNNTMDMSQTLSGLKNGVYELQISGAFRPCPMEDVASTNYAAMLCLNDNQNYFQAAIEDMISADAAIDGENCHLTGDNPDIEVEKDGVTGYILNRVESCCNAFQAGRYQNSILVNVTDGTLTLRIYMPGTGQQPEWLGLGNIKVYYRGTLQEAGDAMDNVLASQAARAYTMLHDYIPSSMSDYANYPNFSQALKDELQAAIDEIPTTTELSAKYALIEKFSRLFQEVYECKKAYISLLKQVDRLYDLYTTMHDILSSDELEEMLALADALGAAYMDGIYTTEEASQQHIGQFSWYQIPSDGVFHISTARDFLIFSVLVNAGENQMDAVLEQDIELDEVMNLFTMVGGSPSGVYVKNGTYAGTFDGQFHTITYHKVADSNSWGLFGNLSGKVCNLRVTGSITTDGFLYMAGLVNTLNGGSIRNCVCDVDIINVSGDGFHGGISRVAINNGGGGEIIDCVYAGTISGSTAQKCAGIICWVEFGTKVTNCLFAGSLDINLSGNTSYIIARNPGGGVFTNCYYLNETGVVNANTTQVTQEQMANGELCALLNGEAEIRMWTQRAGLAYPIPFALATGVESVDNAQKQMHKDNAIYDLSGRKLSHSSFPARIGVYIVGGKKFVFKK